MGQPRPSGAAPRQARPDPKPRTETRGIKPTDVLTQAEVESEIRRLLGEAEDALTDLAKRAVDYAEAEHAYKVKFAKERLKKRAAGGQGPSGRATDDECNDTATVECDEELFERITSTSFYEVAKQRCRTIDEQLDALRTISANIRSKT